MASNGHGGCVLVTGASRGIGAAVARRIARDGLTVAVNYRADAEGAAAVVEEIAAAGGEAFPAPADVTQPEAVNEMFDGIERDHGPVLRVVNNAGTRHDGLLPQIGEDDWNAVIETNLSGAYRVTRRAIRPMLRARFGRIVNVASIVGPRANPGQSNYAASKAGLIGFTKSTAVEVARRGITVNAIAPGLVRTELTEDVADGIVQHVPARRSGAPEEIAACIPFLLSEDASYVTGAVLVVDGGLSA
ncbi:MAG TPA: 3-oxoacyl-ACP reductase FabG [Thermoleophilaceae bacterium]